MDIPFTQIDAFAKQAFQGNQACILPLDNWLDDETLQKIAAENNVAETAYILPAGENRWELRWFTPAIEVPLCGHATLAAAHYLYSHAGCTAEHIVFETRQSGALYVSRLADGRLEMNFPAIDISPTSISDEIIAALGAEPVQAFAGGYYCAVFESVDEIHALNPDLTALAKLGIAEMGWGLGNFGCLALGGDGVDVTSRFFAPGSGINEDPATGSWHCALAPIVAQLTGKFSMDCFQAYPGRGAHIGVELIGDRVKLRGHAVTTIDGTFYL